MTEPAVQDGGVAVDANDVVDELVAHVGRLARENAILRAQLKTYTSPTHQVQAAQ